MPFTPGNLDNCAAIVFLVLPLADRDWLDAAVGAGGDKLDIYPIFSLALFVEHWRNNQ
ncbi:MAG: hypothetical protein KKD28_05920 [Chloroflexi bacterium]|nr:hypothetical protein [Chloroflexota bacterium]MBU1660992.1 hypothetical protein [Chloroflexota bacterium]